MSTKSTPTCPSARASSSSCASPSVRNGSSGIAAAPTLHPRALNARSVLSRASTGLAHGSTIARSPSSRVTSDSMSTKPAATFASDQRSRSRAIRLDFVRIVTGNRWSASTRPHAGMRRSSASGGW